MKKGAALFFPDAPCCDYFAIYYDWLINKVKRECDREELAKTLLAVRDEQTIHNIDSISTSYCNLNCKECSNGMQYRKNKKRIPLERQAQSLNALTNFLPVSYCNMQGGEPLLDPELAERIRMHGNNPRIAFLTLATNGTLLPNDAVMQAMRDTGLMLRISDYGALSKMKLQIMHKAELFSVPCDVYHRAESWVSYGKLERRGRSHAQNRAAAESCHFGTKDLMVYDGYIYSCCRTLYADALGMDNEAVRSNRLCLTQPFSREELDAIVFGKSLYRMCDYCDAPMRVIPVAEQMPRG
ncbi:MAG: radical SAM protein [Oscillospiraceae bacterium]|nr:radical SAM protein [Oscillospiraceae bacterium]